MGRDKEFEEWYKEYFCNTQGEDSPFTYDDVKMAFYSGWKWHKRSQFRSNSNGKYINKNQKEGAK